MKWIDEKWLLLWILVGSSVVVLPSMAKSGDGLGPLVQPAASSYAAVVVTNILVSLSPGTLPKLTTFSASGFLTAGYGAGLGGKIVLLLFQWSSSYVQLTTQSDGSFSHTTTSPNQDGVYKVWALFYGESLTNTGLSPSLGTTTLTVQTPGAGFTLTVKVQTSWGGAIAGYTLQLLDSTEKLIGQGNTDGTGTVKFTGLAGGTYFLIGYDSQPGRCASMSRTLQISKDTAVSIDCSTGGVTVAMNLAGLTGGWVNTSSYASQYLTMIIATGIPPAIPIPNSSSFGRQL